MLALVALLSAVAVCTGGGTAAQAAGYLEVHGGRLPDGTAVAAGPWQGLNDGALSGGSFGVAMPANSALGWSQAATLSPPSGTTFGGLWVTRDYDAPTSIGGAQPAIDTSFELASAGSALSGNVAVPAVSMASIRVSCVDPGGAGPSARCSGAAFWRASAMRYTLRDVTPPTGALDSGGGPLLSGAWVTSPKALRLMASDQGGGIYRVFVRDGSTTYYTAADPSDASCAPVTGAGGGTYHFAATASTLIPCQTDNRLYAPTVDIAAWGDGTHGGLTIGVEDAAGNETVLATGRTIKVNAPGGSLTDLGAGGPGGCVYASDGTTCVALVPLTAPQLSGPAQEGGTLTVTGGTWSVDGLPASYAWQRCAASSCMTIGGASGPTYVITDQDAGFAVRAIVTVSAASTSATAPSSESAVIPARTTGGSASTGGSGREGGGAGVSDRAGPGAPVPPDRVPGAAETASPAVVLPVLNGFNATPGATLTASFKNGSATTWGTYARTNMIVGTLRTPAGLPISGASVQVDEIPDVPGAQPTATTTARTDEQGRYTTTVGHGPSRRVQVSYRPSADGTTVVAAARIRVRAVVSLRVRPANVAVNRSLTLAGRLRYLRRAGVQVRIEALDGRTWRSFAFVKTTQDGRFKYRYRFKTGAEGRRFYFRVYVDSPIYPFAPAPSEALPVRVR